MEETLYNALLAIIANVHYGYYDGGKDSLPVITYKLTNIGRIHSTEDYSETGQAFVWVISKTQDQTAALANSVKALDWTKLSDPKIIKFAFNLELPDETAGHYVSQIVFDYEREA